MMVNLEPCAGGKVKLLCLDSLASLAPPLVFVVAILASKCVGKHNLQSESKGVTAEKFFGMTMFGTAAYSKDL